MRTGFSDKAGKGGIWEVMEMLASEDRERRQYRDGPSRRKAQEAPG